MNGVAKKSARIRGFLVLPLHALAPSQTRCWNSTLTHHSSLWEILRHTGTFGDGKPNNLGRKGLRQCA